MTAVGALKRLFQMKQDPNGEWRVRDFAIVCEGLGAECTKPPGRNHVVISHPGIHGFLTIPTSRPIKPLYVKLMLELAESILAPV